MAILILFVITDYLVEYLPPEIKTIMLLSLLFLFVFNRYLYTPNAFNRGSITQTEHVTVTKVLSDTNSLSSNKIYIVTNDKTHKTQKITERLNDVHTGDKLIITTTKSKPYKILSLDLLPYQQTTIYKEE